MGLTSPQHVYEQCMTGFRDTLVSQDGAAFASSRRPFSKRLSIPPMGFSSSLLQPLAFRHPLTVFSSNVLPNTQLN
ncbi:hypothetical protein E2C01_008947 [Portunus trituberculatus]|uniref:Uncharacterized protein n=1 Tax=Portunus trituberculatus TaxID=210409 RepID=A0A5B7D250_PORTR|nr:hypothetical protein [Portunus trituberculatus]